MTKILFHHRWLKLFLAVYLLSFSFFFIPGALADVGDTCQNAQGQNVDQLCNVGAGELCVEGICTYVSLNEGGSGLSIPVGNVEVSESIVQDRTLGELLIQVVNYFIGFLGVVATIMFIYAGVLWVVSAGNEDLIGKAKSIMTYASLGIVVIIFSFTVVRFITAAGDNGNNANSPNNQGNEEGGVNSGQCLITTDCAEGNYCFQGQCQESVKTICQDNSQCGTGNQCSPLGFCFDPNAGSGASCQNDNNCNLGFVCNVGTQQCDLAGKGSGGGVLGGDNQAEAEEALKDTDAVVKDLSGEVDDLNEDIDNLPAETKDQISEALNGGLLKDKKASLSALMEESQDTATDEVLNKLITYLERLEDLRGELDGLREVMPESSQTIASWDQASLSLDEAIQEPRSSIKYRRFEKDYEALKKLIRQFPVVQSRIRALPGEGNVPFTVTFNGLDSVDPTGGTISEYKWSFLDNDGNLVSLGNEPVVVHTFSESNTYSVRLQVSTSQTDEGGYKMATDGVSVVRVKASPPASKVDFKVDGKTVDEVYRLTLKEAKAGLSLDPSVSTPAFGRTIERYEWLFGDGTSEIRDTASTVVHSYQAAGEYLITLKIRDNSGIEDRKVLKLVLKPLAASAEITPLQGDVNTEFTFKGIASRSDNGSIGDYQWEVMDENEAVIATFQDPDVRYKFEQPGEYQIALTVTDTSGQTDRSVRTIKVVSRAPIAHFTTHIPEKNQPNHFQFDASSSYDLDLNDALTYSWDFEGDGGFEVVESTEFLNTHTYRQPGSYKAILQVQDRFGERSQVEQAITVDSILGGEILLDQKSFRVGEEVTFKSSSPSAVAYLWDFGDGQTLSTETDSVTHTYAEKGKYNVVLHFFDREDNSNTDNTTVLIGDQDVPLALASAMVDDYTPAIIENACGEGKNAMKVSRSDRVVLSAVDSVNRDGTSRLLDYAWKVSEEVQNNNRDFTYRFTELSPADQCASATLLVKDQISGQTSQQDTLYFKVTNQLPTLSDLTLETLTDPLVTPAKVRLRVINPLDKDGQVRLYRWWYFKEGNEQQKLGVHSTTTPETEMVITAEGQSGMENLYVFVVEMTDSDNGIYNSQAYYGPTSQLQVLNGPNLAPVAEFSVDKTTIGTGDAIRFVSKSYDPQGDILPNSAFRWDFNGDGTYEDTTTGAQVTHTYTTPGQFNAKLNVNYRGLSSNVTHAINVQSTNQFPQSAFTYRVNGSTVNFNASSSRFDPKQKNSTLIYEWDFNTAEDSDGNGVKDDDIQSNEMKPEFDYKQKSLYSVRLKVKETSGKEGILIRKINLNGSPAEWERQTYRSLKVTAANHPMTHLILNVAPILLNKGESTEIRARVENADKTAYKGEVFFEIVEGSGELTPNPALSPAENPSEAIGIFTATNPGTVRVRVRAANTFHGDMMEEVILTVK